MLRQRTNALHIGDELTLTEYGMIWKGLAWGAYFGNNKQQGLKRICADCRYICGSRPSHALNNRMLKEPDMMCPSPLAPPWLPQLCIEAFRSI